MRKKVHVLKVSAVGLAAASVVTAQVAESVVEVFWVNRKLPTATPR